MPKSISFSTFHAGNSCVEIVIVFQMYTNIFKLVYFQTKIRFNFGQRHINTDKKYAT